MQLLPQSPAQARPHPLPATVLRAVAAEDKTGIDASKIGTLVYKQDAESWQDVMAFAWTCPGGGPPGTSCRYASTCCLPSTSDCKQLRPCL